MSALTRRQFEVMRLVALGRTYGQIADELGIGYRTVRTHVSAATIRLRVPDRLSVFRTAGWLVVPEDIDLDYRRHTLAGQLETLRDQVAALIAELDSARRSAPDAIPAASTSAFLRGEQEPSGADLPADAA